MATRTISVLLSRVNNFIDMTCNLLVIHKQMIFKMVYSIDLNFFFKLFVNTGLKTMILEDASCAELLASDFRKFLVHQSNNLWSRQWCSKQKMTLL